MRKMEKNGFAIQEIVILGSVLAILFGVAITKFSFALKDAEKEEELLDLKHHNLIVAAEGYARFKEFKEPETYLFGKELIENGILMDLDDRDYEDAKIKITYQEETDTYHAEIVF